MQWFRDNFLGRFLGKKTSSSDKAAPEPRQEAIPSDDTAQPVESTASETGGYQGAEEQIVIQSRTMDKYDPEKHHEAASRIEPRLRTLVEEGVITEENAQERRDAIGIIQQGGREWIFVDISNLPVQTANPHYQSIDGSVIELEPFDARTSTKLQPGQYSENNGVVVAADLDGRVYMSAMQETSPDGSHVIASGRDGLYSREFERTYEYVPFSNFFQSDASRTFGSAKAVRAALLNAVAPGLAEDYMPGLENAGKYSFLNDSNGEVMAGIPIRSQTLQIESDATQQDSAVRRLQSPRQIKRPGVPERTNDDDTRTR